jgi:intein/homing endonuclease
MNEILLSENEIISLYKDAEDIKLYSKVMETRKNKKIGSWRIARLLDAWDHKGTINGWLYSKEKPKGVKAIEELKKAGLFPLRVSNSKEFSHFVHIFGFRYADGCIYYQKRNKTYTFYLCFGNKKDAENLAKDCKKIWGMDLGYFYSTGAYYVYIPASIARIMIALGSPVGRKISQLFRVPEFIFGLPDILKWEFISGIFTGDGSAPRLQPNLECSWSLKLSLNSEKKIVEKFRDGFMRDLWVLLNQLGIKSSKPEIKWNLPRISKKGVITYPVILRILTEKGNMIKFLKNVKYRYSFNYYKKSKKSLDVLRGKKQIIQLRNYLSNPYQKPPKICVYLGQPRQKELIEKAAKKLAGEKKTGIYKGLAKHLCSKCRNAKNFKFLWRKYLPDWKYREIFIPIDCVVEFSKLCNIKISEIEKEIKKVKFIKVHNKFAVPYKSGENDIIRGGIDGPQLRNRINNR